MAWQFYDNTGSIKRTTATTSIASNVDTLAVGETINSTNLQTDLARVEQKLADLQEELDAHNHDRRYTSWERPTPYSAAMWMIDSGAPKHTAGLGIWQVVGGSGTDPGTWQSLWDVRPPEVSAQVDTANKRIYSRKSGIYLCIGSITWANITAGKRLIAGLFVNGALADYQDFHTGITADYAHKITSYVYIPSGSYLDLQAWQNDSTSEAYAVTGATDYWNRLSMSFVCSV